MSTSSSPSITQKPNETISDVIGQMHIFLPKKPTPTKNGKTISETSTTSEKNKLRFQMYLNKTLTYLNKQLSLSSKQLSLLSKKLWRRNVSK